MMKPKSLLSSCAMVVALGVCASPAVADPNAGPPICPTAGTPVSGSYRNLTLTGNNFVADGATLTVSGNLAITAGACLDAFSRSTVNVGGSVLVGHGAILGLGCAPEVDFQFEPCQTTTTDDTVGGNLLASDPNTMYLTADTIHGSLISLGGGPGPPPAPFVNFPIKDMTIQGNARISGWNGGWFGFLRNVVSGSVVVTDDTMSESDADEVVTNTVERNLVCSGNSPAVQFGDSGGTSNEVGGLATGECGFDVILYDADYDGGVYLPISVKAP